MPPTGKISYTDKKIQDALIIIIITGIFKVA